MSGVDATHIDAIGVETVEVVLSEYGSDLSRFPTEKQFVSHVTLAPHVPKSGGKPVHKKKRNSASTRVAAALRMAALSLRHSRTALGAYYRKMAQRRGGDVAVFATARKLGGTTEEGEGARSILARTSAEETNVPEPEQPTAAA